LIKSLVLNVSPSDVRLHVKNQVFHLTWSGDRAETLLFTGGQAVHISFKHIILVESSFCIPWSWQSSSLFHFGSFPEMKGFMFFESKHFVSKFNANPITQSSLSPGSYHCY